MILTLFFLHHCTLFQTLEVQSLDSLAETEAASDIYTIIRYRSLWIDARRTSKRPIHFEYTVTHLFGSHTPSVSRTEIVWNWVLRSGWLFGESWRHHAGCSTRRTLPRKWHAVLLPPLPACTHVTASNTQQTELTWACKSADMLTSCRLVKVGNAEIT